MLGSRSTGFSFQILPIRADDCLLRDKTPEFSILHLGVIHVACMYANPAGWPPTEPRPRFWRRISQFLANAGEHHLIHRLDTLIKAERVFAKSCSLNSQIYSGYKVSKRYIIMFVPKRETLPMAKYVEKVTHARTRTSFGICSSYIPYSLLRLPISSLWQSCPRLSNPFWATRLVPIGNTHANPPWTTFWLNA